MKKNSWEIICSVAAISFAAGAYFIYRLSEKNISKIRPDMNALYTKAAEQGKKSGISNANAFINKEKSIPNELISEKIELLKTFAAIPERWNKDKMYDYFCEGYKEAFWETVESCSTYSEDDIDEYLEMEEK